MPSYNTVLAARKGGDNKTVGTDQCSWQTKPCLASSAGAGQHSLCSIQTVLTKLLGKVKASWSGGHSAVGRLLTSLSCGGQRKQLPGIYKDKKLKVEVFIFFLQTGGRQAGMFCCEGMQEAVDPATGRHSLTRQFG